MIILGRIEIPAGLDLGDDRGIEYVALIELGDIALGDARLLGIDGKNCRAILRPDIGALTIELCWIMSDRKIDLQDPPIADQVGVEGDPHRFCVSGGVRADYLVMRCVSGAAGITGDGAENALDMLEHALDPRSNRRQGLQPRTSPEGWLFRRASAVGSVVRSRVPTVTAAQCQRLAAVPQKSAPGEPNVMRAARSASWQRT